MDKPQVTRRGVFDMQVCVPSDWDDGSIETFAEDKNPSGTTRGWFIRTDQKLLAGDPVRQPCAERSGYVHLMLDC
jgi:hypothetical protein